MGLTMKQWRLARELTQNQMADKCGVHRNTYASWEEKPENVSVKNAQIIANALDVTVEDIFFNPELYKM